MKELVRTRLEVLRHKLQELVRIQQELVNTLGHIHN